MHHKKGSFVPGIVLIAIGLYFLLRQFIESFSVWEQIYPICILLISGFLLWDYWRKKNPKILFWGIFFLCIGAFFVLRNYNFIPYLYLDEYWPVFLIALGFSFIIRFIAEPQDWGVLIPGTILLFIGLKNMADAFHEVFWDWDWEFYLDDLWPVILIVIGLGIIISGLHALRLKDKDEEKQELRDKNQEKNA
jgi:hypothetical protein